jgi:hypothetical protein
MGEIHEPHHAENEGNAQRAEGIDAAQAKRVDDDLDDRGHAQWSP